MDGRVSGGGKGRFITFNCFHGRAEFLRQDAPGLDFLPGLEVDAPGAAKKVHHCHPARGGVAAPRGG